MPVAQSEAKQDKVEVQEKSLLFLLSSKEKFHQIMSLSKPSGNIDQSGKKYPWIEKATDG